MSDHGNPSASRELVKSMQLAGKPLESPVFVPTGWLKGAKFFDVDDPDRTHSSSWTPPTFVFEDDPIMQSMKTTVTELDVSKMSTAKPYSFARMVRFEDGQLF
jgi:hypothetical protein